MGPCRFDARRLASAKRLDACTAAGLQEDDDSELGDDAVPWYRRAKLWWAVFWLSIGAILLVIGLVLHSLVGTVRARKLLRRWNSTPVQRRERG